MGEACTSSSGSDGTLGELRAAERLLSIRSRMQRLCNNTGSDAGRGSGNSNHHHLLLDMTVNKNKNKKHASVQGGGGDADDGDGDPDNEIINTETISKRRVFQLLEYLYRDHPGAVWRAASRKALDAQQESQHMKHLVYGEISFIALENLLSLYVPLVNRQKHDGIIFYDLGCGAGRVVFAAALLHTNIKKSCGVEILSSMHHMNQELLQLYKIEIHPHLHPLKQNQQVQFLCANFLQVDWGDADMVFTNATCFNDVLFEKLEECANVLMKEGSIVITVTRPFTNQTIWETLERQERRMSWSSTMVFVHRKRGAPLSTLQTSSSSVK